MSDDQFKWPVSDTPPPRSMPTGSRPPGGFDFPSRRGFLGRPGGRYRAGVFACGGGGLGPIRFDLLPPEEDVKEPPEFATFIGQRFMGIPVEWEQTHLPTHMREPPRELEESPSAVAVREGRLERRGRLGRLVTPHGAIFTPAFMPVGTLGAVKGLPSWELEALGANVMLSNFYHLAVRPGLEQIIAAGGVHDFTGWRGPILTDSGGYQIWSLPDLRKIDDDGVSFRNHVDGSPMRLTPESVVDGQYWIGVDIAMVLDECPPAGGSYEEVAASWKRTLAWAGRARDAWARHDAEAGLFGIVQGGVYDDLRRRAARDLEDLDFDGYAIGGVSVGEPEADRRRVVEVTAPELPFDKPRYLMGVGYPLDIGHAVLHGVDLFDCVLPSRNARHGLLFQRGGGVVKIKNSRYQHAHGPIDAACACPVCQQHTLAFVHHLFRCGDITGQVLATVHNVYHYLDFMSELRQAIATGVLVETIADWCGVDPAELNVSEEEAELARQGVALRERERERFEEESIRPTAEEWAASKRLATQAAQYADATTAPAPAHKPKRRS